MEVAGVIIGSLFFFFSSRRRHTRLQGDWSSDVCSSDLAAACEGAIMARVLLVDDEPALLFTLSQLLKSRGLEPVLAHSAKEALAKLDGEIGRASCRERV